MSQFDPTKEKDGPPVEVKEVAQYLARYSVFFLICAIIMATVPIVSKRDFDTNALCAVTIPMGLAIIDAICASAFYSLSPWSYSVVYFLLLCHWGGVVFGFLLKRVKRECARPSRENQNRSTKDHKCSLALGFII